MDESLRKLELAARESPDDEGLKARLCKCLGLCEHCGTPKDAWCMACFEPIIKEAMAMVREVNERLLTQMTFPLEWDEFEAEMRHLHG